MCVCIVCVCVVCVCWPCEVPSLQCLYKASGSALWVVELILSDLLVPDNDLHLSVCRPSSCTKYPPQLQVQTSAPSDSVRKKHELHAPWKKNRGRFSTGPLANGQ